MHTIETATIAGPMDDNQALREILGEVRVLSDSLREEYIAIDKLEGPITDVVSLVRPSNLNAVRTLVTNVANDQVKIYESGVLVKVLPGLETWVSPMAGQGEIWVKTDTGLSTYAVIATYVKGG